MSDYTEYLAANVLNEERTVGRHLVPPSSLLTKSGHLSYTQSSSESAHQFSEAVSVMSRCLYHHTHPSRMLYDFHQKQNKKKAGTVHATYLISGRQRDPDAQDSSQSNAPESQDSQGDIPMSSPFPSSAPQPDTDETPPRLMRAIVVAKEEDLEDAKSEMDEIDCVHIYSLEPGPVKDIQVLTDCHRRLEAEFKEDPLVVNKQYGIIQNPEVRRRTNKRPAPVAVPAPAAATKPQVKAASVVKKEDPKTEEKEKEKEKKPTEQVKAVNDASDVDSDASSKKGKSGKPPVLKRDSSSIFKSFAKTKPKAAKKQAQPQSQPSTEASPAISDDEADEDTIMADEDTAEQPTGKSKKDREDELKKMMEAEDEPMDDASAAEPDEELEPEPEPVTEAPKEEPKDEIQVSNGRRRGRRRVMKKVTTKDAEGYLGTFPKMTNFYRRGQMLMLATQSRKKSRLGRTSARTSPHRRRRSKSLPHRLLRPRARQRKEARVRVIS